MNCKFKINVAFDSSYSWWILILIMLNNMAGLGYGFGTASILNSKYPALLGLEPSQTNLIGSVLTSVILFSVPVTACLVKRFGSRRISAIACVLIVSGIVLSAFSVKLWHLLLGYSVLAGLGMSMNLMSTIGIVPHYFQKRKNMAYAATGFGSGVAFLLYPYAMKSLFAEHGYRNTILLLLPLPAMTITAPLFFKEKKLNESGNSATVTWREQLHPFKRIVAPIHFINSTFWNMGHVAIVIILFSYVERIISTVRTSAIELNNMSLTTSGSSNLSDQPVPPSAQATNNISSTHIASLVMTIFGIGNALGGLVLTGVLSYCQLNHYLLQIVCNLISGTCALVIAASPSPTSFYTCACIIGFFYSVTISNMGCLCNHLYPTQDVELAFSYQDIFGGIGSFVGPWTAGLIQAKYGTQYGFYYIGSCLLIGGVELIIAAAVRPNLWIAKKAEKDEKQQDLQPGDVELTPLAEEHQEKSFNID